MMSGKNGKAEVLELDLAKVIPTRDNPRRKPKVTDEAVKELALSIKAHGQLQPVLVRPHPTKAGFFDLRARARRVRVNCAMLWAGVE